jgi:hypothetical protein
VLSVLDFAVNSSYLPVYFTFEKKLRKKNINYKLLHHIDDDAALFITNHNTSELFRRNKEEMNWMIDNPWITTEKPESDQHYAFSHHAKTFRLDVVSIYDDKKICGFFMLLIRDGNAKLIYTYSEPDSIPLLIDVLYILLLEKKVNSFVTFNQPISEYIQKNSNPFLHTRKQIKTIAFPQDMSSVMYSSKLQDGDGDCFFV